MSVLTGGSLRDICSIVIINTIIGINAVLNIISIIIISKNECVCQRNKAVLYTRRPFGRKKKSLLPYTESGLKTILGGWGVVSIKLITARFTLHHYELLTRSFFTTFFPPQNISGVQFSLLLLRFGAITYIPTYVSLFFLFISLRQGQDGDDI